LQVLVLVIGLAWACLTAQRIARERRGAATGQLATPVMAYCLLITVGMLWLLVG
jgi:hypothetical protein